MSEYVGEPIDKLYDRVKRGNEFMLNLDKNSVGYESIYNRFFKVLGHFLERLAYLDAIRMFGDKDLMKE